MKREYIVTKSEKEVKFKDKNGTDGDFTIERGLWDSLVAAIREEVV